MQFASQGLRSATRKASNVITHSRNGGGTNSSRTIHLSSFIGTSARVGPNTVRNSTYKLFSQSRHFLVQFFAQLTAPGVRLPALQSSRSLYTGRTGLSNIRAGFAPLRTAAQRTLFLPHGPRPVARMTQVGLGTARNFSSSRPIFQNLVENVPIIGRALSEADWELNMHTEQRKMRRAAHGKGKKVEKTETKLRPYQKENVKATSADSSECEMEHYFPSITVPSVTTCLLIPLAPTPSSRVPLSATESSADRLLPLAQLSNIHTSHEMHSLRVSTLFTRLDQSNVWARGVLCSSYSQAPGIKGTEGVCTVLKVEFVGWTKAEVRSVIGESGTGWCVLEEVRQEDEEGLFSDTCSSVSSGAFDQSSETGSDFFDPALSLVLPSIDLSSASSAQSVPDGHMFASLSGSNTDDSWVDRPLFSSRSSGMGSDLSSWAEPPTNGWLALGFSSEFASRQGSEPALREEYIF